MPETKIRQLKCDEVLPWELEVAQEESGTDGESATDVPSERKKLPVANIVRALGFKRAGEVAAAYDAHDVDRFKTRKEEGDVDKDNTKPKDKGRPPGWCMPGGKVNPGETPMHALVSHEAGELIWEIVGDPIFLTTIEK